MDQETWRTLLVVGAPAITGLVWLVRLEGRVNTLERLQQDVRDDLRYIRERLDNVLG